MKKPISINTLALETMAKRLAKRTGFDYVLEHRFHDKRRWRFDLAFPAAKVAVEVEGGVWAYGRHTRGKGFLGDMEKYNSAVMLGWFVLRFTWDSINDGSAEGMIEELLMCRDDAAGT